MTPTSYPAEDETARPGPRRDLYAAGAAALLVVTAALVGHHIQNTDGTLFVGWPPLFASWGPHTGPGSPAAVLVAVAVVVHGPALAARLPWRGLLAAVWAAALAWTLSLALVDGWQRGVVARLTTRYEYLQVVDRFQDIPAALRGFASHILADSADPWPAHVVGHPPAATLTFVLLDRIGLRGGGWAGTWCLVVGATAATAVLVAVRALADERLARRAAPFVVLAPAAVWMGTSADAYFTAVAAWAVALLALALTRSSAAAAAGCGLLFGLTCYLSYGLVLIAVIGVAVVYLGRRGLAARPALLVPFTLGLAAVPVAFASAGFDWWAAYHLLVTRYHQGIGGIRPYGYWVWANLACTVLLTGPAIAAGLRRTGVVLGRTRDRAGATTTRAACPAAVPAMPTPGTAVRTAVPDRAAAAASTAVPNPPARRNGAFETAPARLALLVAAAVLAVLVADLSGMSKAETERIWLPFAVWLLAAGAFLTRPRAWLATQAMSALLLNHLLWTGW
ncbi:hypothetical protein ACIQ9E_06655 [Streptomyces sp. NPDC094448]|uniref:hypothetical protein n=1 Tax=Streptomyces sp. NPDC094448 TaxID=3366063 RepID=UPI00381B7622